MYLEWIGTLGSFGMVARPLEFISAFKLRLPPLEVRREQRDSNWTKQGNGPSSQDEEGNTGHFWSCGGTLGILLEWREVCRGSS